VHRRAIGTHSLYRRGNCSKAGDFGTDPHCSRLREGSPIAVQRFNAPRSSGDL